MWWWLYCYIRKEWTSLVVQWRRIHLPMQGTQVQCLIWEDSTCRGATKSMLHNYWTCAPELKSHNYWAPVLQLLKPECWSSVVRNRKSPQWDLHTAVKSGSSSPQLEKACAKQQRSSAAKNKQQNNKRKRLFFFTIERRQPLQ